MSSEQVLVSREVLGGLFDDVKALLRELDVEGNGENAVYAVLNRLSRLIESPGVDVEPLAASAPASSAGQEGLRAALTVTVDMLADCWQQWSYPLPQGHHSGGLSTLERLESVLGEAGFMDDSGTLVHMDALACDYEDDHRAALTIRAALAPAPAEGAGPTITTTTDVPAERLDAMGAEIVVDLLRAAALVASGAATISLTGPELRWALGRLAFPQSGAERMTITYAPAPAQGEE